MIHLSAQPDFSALTQVLATLKTSLGYHALTHCDPSWTEGRLHNDPFGRMYWVRDGEGWTEHHGRRFRLRPGVLYAIPAHTPSYYHCPLAMNLYWLHFTAHVLHSIDLFTFLDGCYAIAPSDPAWVQTLWEQLLRHGEDTPGNRLVREGIVRQLLAIFIDQYDAERHSVQARGIVQYHAVLAYIEQHLHARITLAELAEIAHLQPTYFSHQFARHMGEAPMAYINRRRVERAKTLLWDTELPLHIIAQQVGFCDAYYFSRIFKRLAHLTPGQFRRGQRKGP